MAKAINRMMPARSSIVDTLSRAARSGGWIAVFTAYRNLFTHVAPLQSVQGSHDTWQDTRSLYGRSEPQIYYPLPGDPEALLRQQSISCVRATSPRASNLPPNRNREPDALDYLANTLNRFVELADLLAATSPVKPELPVLTDEDILHIEILDA